MYDTRVPTAPLGPLGWMAERLVLRQHLTRFLTDRNAKLKSLAESNGWHAFLDAPASD